MLIKLVIVGVLIAILYSLGSALFYMVKSGGSDDRTVKSLTVRVALSVGLFILLLVAAALGWIKPHGIY
jgi:hypothetical protein